uniref:Uncharacterized protein n=1 Tax=Sipha flava TaxID=143950 RepID=A0A2S2R4J8_9HEMI
MVKIIYQTPFVGRCPFVRNSSHRFERSHFPDRHPCTNGCNRYRTRKTCVAAACGGREKTLDEGSRVPASSVHLLFVCARTGQDENEQRGRAYGEEVRARERLLQAREGRRSSLNAGRWRTSRETV